MPEEADATRVDTAAVMDFIAQNSGEEAPEAAADTPSVDPTDTAATEVEQTPDADPLGPDPDLSDLDPAQRAFLEKRILDLRGNYTQKTTKLADANRILEAAGGDPETLLEAFNFQQLLADPGPEGDDARARLYQAMHAQYGQQAPEQQPTPETPEDPFSDYDLPPEIRERLSMVDQLNARLGQFETSQQKFAQEQAQAAYLQEVSDDITFSLDKITEEYPDLADARDDILDLGYSTEGNMLEAMDKYRAIETRIMARLFEGSVNVPGGQVSPPAGGGHSTEPVEINTFKDAGKAAKEFIERMNAELS